MILNYDSKMKFGSVLALAVALMLCWGRVSADNGPIPGFRELPDSAKYEAVVDYYRNGPGGAASSEIILRARALLAQCESESYLRGMAFARFRVMVQHYQMGQRDSVEHYRLVIEKEDFSHMDCVDQQHFLLMSSHVLEAGGNTDEAMRRALNAIEVGENCHQAIAFAYSAVGGMLRKMERYEESVAYFMEAIEHAELNSKSDTIGLSNSFTNLSTVYTKWGKQDSSYKYALLALQVVRTPLTLFRMANWYADNGFPDEALTLLFEAGDSIDRSQVYHMKPSLNRYLSKCYRLKGEEEKAVAYAEKGLSLITKKGDLTNAQMAYTTLVQAHLGKNADLVDSLRRYDKEMIAVATQKSTLDLEKKYETAKKEKANLALKAELKDKTIAALQTRNLLVIAGVSILLVALLIYLWSMRRRLKTKAKISALQKQAADLQMNPHFFFNALNSINLFIAKNEKDQARLYLNNFSRLMRLTLQNSLQETIPLEKELDYLKNYLSLEQLRMKNFDFEFEVPEALLGHKIPSMLIQPLVENSLLHGFKGIDYRGLLKIRVQKAESVLKVEVLDNGKGIHQSQAEGLPADLDKKSIALDLLVKRIAFFGAANSGIELGEGIPEGDRPGTRVAFSLPVIN